MIDASDPGLSKVGKPADHEFPDGLVSFTAVGVPLGGTITVTLTFPTPIIGDATYYKYQGGFFEFAGAVFNGNTVVLTLTDGVSGDLDGLENGTINDPGGVAVPVATSSGTNTTSGGGGGCFIETVRE